MKFQLLSLVAGLAFTTSACGGASPTPNPQPRSAQPVTPSSDQSDPTPKGHGTEPTPDDTPPAETAGAKLAYQIGGSSLSEVELTTVQAALQKAGYGLVGPTDPTTCGGVETVQLGLARQGKPVGMLALHRKAKSATPDCTPTSIKETYDTWKKAADDPKSSSAMIYDDKADVLLAITILDDGRAAKALMDAVLR
jgi:hypothetical protein